MPTIKILFSIILSIMSISTTNAQEKPTPHQILVEPFAHIEGNKTLILNNVSFIQEWISRDNFKLEGNHVRFLTINKQKTTSGIERHCAVFESDDKHFKFVIPLAKKENIFYLKGGNVTKDCFEVPYLKCEIFNGCDIMLIEDENANAEWICSDGKTSADCSETLLLKATSK